MAVVVVLAIVLRRFVEADVSPLYLAAVMLSAWRGGLGAGLLATALAAFLDTFFSRPPLYSPAVDTEICSRWALSRSRPSSSAR